VHQVADRGCVFRGTDGIVAHHAFETLHGPRSMEGENFVEKGFAVGKGACLMHKPAARSMKGPFVGTGIEATVFLLETGHLAMARIEAASRGATPILSALINVVWSVCVCVELA
jgi:hypothetical protein